MGYDRAARPKASARRSAGKAAEPAARGAATAGWAGAGGHDIAALPGRGGGKPIPGRLRARLEKGFGWRLGHIRLHTGAAAHALTMKHRARAAAWGPRDIFLGRGEYAPDTAEGRRVIGHEVAHSLQQEQGRVPLPRAGAVNAEPRLEREADRAGARAAEGVPAWMPVAAGGRAAATTPPGAAAPLQLQSKKRKLHAATPAHLLKIRKSLDKFGKSTGSLGFYDRRSRTAFGYRSGSSRQGPHTMSHISKRVLMAVGRDLGLDPLDLVGTPFAPRPRVLNRMLRQRIRQGGAGPFAKSRRQRTLHLRNYNRHWNIAKDPAQSGAKRLESLKRLGEMNPAATYGLTAGTATPAQMAGKGENRSQVAQDFGKIVANPAGFNAGTQSGGSVFDFSGASALGQRQAQRQAATGLGWLSGHDEDEDSGSSESDSEVDLDDW